MFLVVAAGMLAVAVESCCLIVNAWWVRREAPRTQEITTLGVSIAVFFYMTMLEAGLGHTLFPN